MSKHIDPRVVYPPKQLDFKVSSLSDFLAWPLRGLDRRRLTVGVCSLGIVFGLLAAMLGPGGWIETEFGSSIRITSSGWESPLAMLFGFQYPYHAFYSFLLVMFCSLVLVICWARLPQDEPRE